MADIPVTPSQDLSALLRRANPGDNFILEDGIYAGGVYVSSRPGLQIAPITVKARNPGMAIIRGNSATRTDALGILSCPWWQIQDLIFEQAARFGLQIGTSPNVTVSRCISRYNATSGVMCGNSSFFTIEDSQAYENRAEHGIYCSGKPDGIIIRRNRMWLNGKSGAQANNQGSGGSVTNARFEQNIIWQNGLNGAAGLNLIGVVNSAIEDNYINDNYASGIAMSGGCTGNLLDGNIITFSSPIARQCITSTELAGAGCVNSLSGNIVRMAKSTVPAIEAKGGSAFVQVDTVVLPVATPITIPITPPNN